MGHMITSRFCTRLEFLNHRDRKSDGDRRQLSFCVHACKELRGRDAPRCAFWPGDGDDRIERNQRGSEARRAHVEGGAFVAEDGMVAVFAAGHQGHAAVFAEQAEAVAEVPAARTLAEIAADRAHITDLLAGDAKSAGFAVVDPEAWICTSTTCPAEVGNYLVYRDDTHLTATFSAWLAPLVAPLLTTTKGS